MELQTHSRAHSGRTGLAESPSEPWHDLLKPAHTPPRCDDGALVEDDIAISETDATLFALGVVVEQRDRQTAGHCERLAFMSVTLGQAMDLDRADLLALYRGAYLHDVGKIGIPDAILLKPGKLTGEEWDVMHTHPARGAQICRHLRSFGPVLPLIRHHHERWDGSGYPDGLRGEQIPLLARVLQIADIYDALTSARPYKPAWAPAQALQVIREETERGWRDPEIVKLFFTLHDGVISKAAQLTGRGEYDLEAMRAALSQLR